MICVYLYVCEWIEEEVPMEEQIAQLRQELMEERQTRQGLEAALADQKKEELAAQETPLHNKTIEDLEKKIEQMKIAKEQTMSAMAEEMNNLRKALLFIQQDLTHGTPRGGKRQNTFFCFLFVFWFVFLFL